MPLPIYKPGRGYWTRVLTACGVGLIVAAGVGWLWAQLNVLSDPLYWQGGMAVALIVGTALLMYYLLNKPNIADFMIATEDEMKKVNWPTWKSIRALTAVVIIGTLMIAAFLWIINLVFGWLFLEINILQTG
jgi:preprotein translocase subunit SecE